eukprot:7738956-Pyramimonas_sp.AAC.1
MSLSDAASTLSLLDPLSPGCSVQDSSLTGLVNAPFLSRTLMICTVWVGSHAVHVVPFEFQIRDTSSITTP